LLTDAQTVEPRALQNDPRVAAFRSTLQSHLLGLPIVKVKIYDGRGMTVFSTERAQIGEDKSGNAGFRQALSGRVATELTYRNQFSAFDDVIEDRNVLSSYVPIEDFAGRIDSVFEIYQDVTPLLKSLQQDGLIRAAVILGLLCAAYVVLVLLRSTT